jgi:hypothetical protein
LFRATLAGYRAFQGTHRDRQREFLASRGDQSFDKKTSDHLHLSIFSATDHPGLHGQLRPLGQQSPCLSYAESPMPPAPFYHLHLARAVRPPDMFLVEPPRPTPSRLTSTKTMTISRTKAPSIQPLQELLGSFRMLDQSDRHLAVQLPVPALKRAMMSRIQKMRKGHEIDTI